MRCPGCDRVLVRHLRQGVGLGDRVAFDWAQGLEDVSYWDFERGGWVVVPGGERFWLSLGPERAYEEALGQYVGWVEEAGQGPVRDELVVVSMNLGRVRGAETDPWSGYVLMGAFRGRDLTFIEPGADEQPEWLRWARRWAIEPGSRYLTRWS